MLLQTPPVAAASVAAGGTPTARLLEYHNTDIVVEAESAQGGWLVLNDPWHPWWVAYLDGQEVPVLQANVLFRAVALPGGKKIVRFKFRPLLGAWRQLSGTAAAR